MNPTVLTIRRRSTSLQVAIAAMLSMGYSIGAQSQELSLSSSVTITQTSGGFNTSASITASSGNVGDVGNIPTATNGVPNFTFSFQGSGVASSSKTFRPGLVIQQVGSSRRLEAQLPLLTLSFDASSNIISGSSSVAAGNIDIRGRDASGTIGVSGTFADNGSSVSITNTTIGFNAGSIMSRIVAANPGNVLNDVVNSFSAGGAYTYTIVLKPISDANVKLGTGGTGTSLTQLPKLNLAACQPGETASGAQNDATSVFILTTGGSLAGNFTSAYALQGRLGVGQVVSGTAPGNLGISCTPTPASGGGGGSSTATNDASVNTAQTNLQNQIPTNGPPTDTLITQVNTTATTVAAQVAAGTASPTTLFTVLDTLNKSLDSQNQSTPASSTAATLASIDTVLKAMANVTLTPTQKTDFQTKIATTITNTAANITERGAGQVGANFVAILNSLGGAIASAARTLNNNTVKNNLLIAAEDASEAASQNASGITNSLKFERTQILLFLALTNATTTGNISINGTVAAEIDYLNATRVSALNGEETKVEISAGVVKTVNDSLLAAVNVAGATAKFDSSSSVTEIRAGNLYVPTFLVSTSLIGSHIPNGFLSAANGGLIAVKDGVAGTYVPAPRDVNGLIATLEKQNIQVSIEADGSLYLVTATGEKFSGAFALESLTTGTLGAANVTFTPATGKPKDASYFIRVTYSDGSVQKLTPYVAENKFYTSLLNRNIAVATDRATGIITGPNNLRMRPDYFVSNLTTADQTFHTANKDSDGVAYRVTTDFNSDGTVDLEVLSTSGKQIVYVLP